MPASVTLGGVDYAMLVGVVTVCMSVVLFTLKSMRADDATFRNELGRRLEGLESRVLAVEKGKVDVRRWAQAEVGTRVKVDEVGNKVSELTGRIDASFGASNALGRLADQVTRLLERTKDG